MSQEIANSVSSIKNDESSDEQLKDIFLKGWNTYEELENTTLPFNSLEFQSKVKTAVSELEKATRIVSRIGMFSSNELIDEVTTESLQYMLLPYFLGKLILKLQHEDRIEVLNVAEVYFKDYLQRCEEYELCAPSKKSEDNKETDVQTAAKGDELAQLMREAHSRNDKIAKFRIKKELEERLKQLKNVVKSDTVDDEIKREYFIKFIKKCVIEALEELDSVKLEKQMAEMRKSELAHKKGDKNGNGNTASGSQGHHHRHEQSKRQPLQPFIIARDAAQKAVFGMGYPSLPIMTVDDFYQQRVEEGIFPDQEKMAKINREKAIMAARDPEELEEEEKAALEAQIEEDDPEYIDRMRRMDEYKDMVRRGDGNRYNRS